MTPPEPTNRAGSSASARYLALAVDYDGTIARGGVVDEATLKALGQVAASGRKLILVTGRELDDLLAVFPGIVVFDQVVAENGAMLFNPATREKRLVAPAPPGELIAELVRRGVEPLSIGTSIVATVEPNETIVLEIIRDLLQDNLSAGAPHEPQAVPMVYPEPPQATTRQG